MIRFIMKKIIELGDGAPHNSFYTIDADVPDLEAAMKSGGFSGGASYEIHSILGCEVLDKDR